MKEVKKYVYYCDFCKKKGLSKHHMFNHEARCTANPKRTCGMCEMSTNIGEYVEELKTRFTISTEKVQDAELDFFSHEEQVCYWHGKVITLAEILDEVDGCPNCTLAVLRQTKLNYACCGLDKYDYKAEFDKASKKKQEYKADEFKRIVGDFNP